MAIIRIHHLLLVHLHQPWSSGFFPDARVYNYPNPVYEGVTYIRYYVSEDANVNIKIFDLAGGLVEELNDNAIGGFDNETEWNINDIQSGVYLARIEASGVSGSSENKIIKIAVINLTFTFIYLYSQNFL
jgi:hypothetical protein